MFLLRSAFWLTIAFVLIAPRAGVDTALAGKMVEAGRGAVQQVLGGDCRSIECVAGKAALNAVAGPNSPSAEAPMQARGTPVPLPRPRPDRTG